MAEKNKTNPQDEQEVRDSRELAKLTEHDTDAPQTEGDTPAPQQTPPPPGATTQGPE